MIKRLNHFRCPYCGESEFVKGRRAGTSYSHPHLIVPLGVRLLTKQQTMISVFCKNCGSLVREYIQRPELLEK